MPSAPAPTSTPPRARSPLPDAAFRAAADQAPQVMWTVNPRGAVTYLNQAWYELVGGMPPKWYGHEWGEVVEPTDLQEMRERWRTASATGSIFEGTRRVRAQDGTWHTLAYKATPVFDANGLVCWVGMDSDITEMMAAQSALRFANQELEAFSYTVSHDLRTPLVTLQGFASVLARELGPEPGPKVAHCLDRITQAVSHMGTLIDGLLALSDVARRPLVVQDVDLSRIAADILGMLERNEPTRSATIAVQPGLAVRGDGRLLTALLENLLGNAWKFTAARPHTEIAFGRAGQSRAESVFFLRDNGAGFDMADAANLFTAFERLHQASEFPGSGIGLATVHRVVTRHGGRVWAESVRGEGSCFYFSLPGGN
jgi:PAS domain S-box-containing protein